MTFPARAMPVLITLALLVPAVAACTDRPDRHCDDKALPPIAALSAVHRPGPGGHGSVGKPHPRSRPQPHSGSHSHCHD